MNEDGDAKVQPPVACTLTPADLTAMRGGLRPGLAARASAVERIPGGRRWRFEPRVDLVKEVAAVLEAERGCCRFLRFLLFVEPGDGRVRLEVTGPEGTEDFLSALLEDG